MILDLFPELEETLSPRAAWMRANDLHVFEMEEPFPDPEDKFIAHQGEADPGCPFALGETEDEALIRLCKSLGIKTWHPSIP